jgi:hypothetical protein
VVRNGLFGESDQELEFSLDDLDNLNRLALSFAIIKAKGELIITLNGKQILNQKLRINRVEVIDLPTEYLEKENKLRLQVNPPGAMFWSSNTYSLKDIKLKEDFELTHSSESLTFSISSSELDSIQDSKLDFYVYCKSLDGKGNVLKATLNGNLILSEFVECSNENYTFDVDPGFFVSGVNTLEFSTSGGNYLMSNIKIINSVLGDVYPSYVFYIGNEIYKDAERFYLNFDMDRGRKKAEIVLNDNTLELDTSNKFIEYDVTDLIKRGNNFVEIVPVNNFKINKIDIGYE